MPTSISCSGRARKRTWRSGARLPPPTPQLAWRASREPEAALLARAVRRLLALGITAVHDFEGAEEERLLRAMSGGGGPRVRVLMHIPHSGLEAALAEGLASGRGDAAFRIGAV